MMLYFVKQKHALAAARAFKLGIPLLSGILIAFDHFLHNGS